VSNRDGNFEIDSGAVCRVAIAPPGSFYLCADAGPCVSFPGARQSPLGDYYICGLSNADLGSGCRGDALLRGEDTAEVQRIGGGHGDGQSTGREFAAPPDGAQQCDRVGQGAAEVERQVTAARSCAIALR